MHRVIVRRGKLIKVSCGDCKNYRWHDMYSYFYEECLIKKDKKLIYLDNYYGHKVKHTYVKIIPQVINKNNDCKDYKEYEHIAWKGIWKKVLSYF